MTKQTRGSRADAAAAKPKEVPAADTTLAALAAEANASVEDEFDARERMELAECRQKKLLAQIENIEATTVEGVLAKLELAGRFFEGCELPEGDFAMRLAVSAAVDAWSLAMDRRPDLYDPAARLEAKTA